MGDEKIYREMTTYRVTTKNCNREVIEDDDIRIERDGFIRFVKDGSEVAVFSSNSIESIIVESKQNNAVGFCKTI